MALIFCDGFDRASLTNANVQDIDWPTKWRTASAPGVVSGQASTAKDAVRPAPTAGVNGGMAMYHVRNNSAGNGILQYILPSHRAQGAGNTLFTSFYIKPENRPTTAANSGFVHFWNDGNTSRIWGGTVPVAVTSSETLITLTTTTAGIIELRRNGTILATGTTVLALGVYYHIEVALTNIEDTGSSCVVKLNGTTEINFTGDLYVGGTKGINGIGFSTTYNTSGFSFWLDDVIIWDSTGSEFNTSMSPRMIYTVTPNGNGAVLNGVPSAGTNWQTQDDTDMGSAFSDFNVLTGAGNYDLLTFAATPIGLVNVEAVVVNAMTGSLGAATRQMAGVVKSGSAALTSGTTYNVPVGSTLTVQGIFTKDPNTSTAWTKSGIDSAQFGYRLVS